MGEVALRGHDTKHYDHDDVGKANIKLRRFCRVCKKGSKS